MKNLFKKCKGLILQLLVITFVMLLPIFCYAQGWTDISGDWYYLDKNGEAYANSFVQKDGETLYLGETGKITRNRLFEHNDSYYYAKENGTLAKNEFIDVKYDEASEIGMQEARYYFGENCKAIRRTGDAFKKLIDGNYYAFDADGVLLIGWLDKDGNILDQGDVLKDGVYCTDENGVLMKNRWYNFVNDIGIFSNDSINNVLNAVEFDKMESMWMYFDDSCKKLQASTLEAEKKKKINGVEYAFDENGIMLTYFNKVGGVDYTQASNPTSKSKAVMYSAEDGQLATNRWFWLYPSRELDEQEYLDQEMHWWHTDKKGKLYTNVIKEIDGKKYVFDGLGRLKAGFVLADGNKYVANFMPEDLTREDFLYNYAQGSRLYGKELSDLRYFGDDDKIDGSMKKGEVDIELSDGVSTFCFRSDGRAYAGRATSSVPQKIKNIYYINGLKLKSIKDKKFGFVRVNDADEAQGQYKLVDKNGKIKKSNKGIYRDDDGNYILVHGDMIVGYRLENELPGPNVTIKWRSAQNGEPAGFYYYDKDTDVFKDHYHYGICVNPLVTPNITDDDLSNVDKDMKLNFK